MKKLNKVTLALVLLGIVSIILALQFDSHILGIFSIAFFTTAGVKWSSQVADESVRLGVESATLGEVLDEKLNNSGVKSKVKEKVLKFTPEQKEKLAEQFVREIGSDTGPISLKKR